jgi:hypothetical protein
MSDPRPQRDPDATGVYQPPGLAPAERFAPGAVLSGRYRVGCRATA